MCNIRWYVVRVDLWVNTIIGEIVVNETEDGSSLLGTSFGKRILK